MHQGELDKAFSKAAMAVLSGSSTSPYRDDQGLGSVRGILAGGTDE